MKEFDIEYISGPKKGQHQPIIAKSYSEDDNHHIFDMEDGHPVKIPKSDAKVEFVFGEGPPPLPRTIIG